MSERDKPPTLDYGKPLPRRRLSFNDVLSVLLIAIAIHLAVIAIGTSNPSARVNIGVTSVACVVYVVLVRYGHKRI